MYPMTTDDRASKDMWKPVEHRTDYVSLWAPVAGFVALVKRPGLLSGSIYTQYFEKKVRKNNSPKKINTSEQFFFRHCFTSAFEGPQIICLCFKGIDELWVRVYKHW